LEEQLTDTSQGIGQTVKVAASIARLKELLATDSTGASSKRRSS
jgi:type I restriction enzyme R subunit